MSDALEFKAHHFEARVKALYEAWPADADSVLIVNGLLDEDVLYKKSTALQCWLFGKEYHDTIVAITERGLVIACRNSEDAAALEALVGSSTNLKHKVISGSGAPTFDQVIEALRASKNGKTVGVSGKEKAVGSYSDSWQRAFDAAGFETANVSTNIAALFLVKDELEVACVRMAGRISALALQETLLPNIESIIDDEKEETQSAIAEKVEDAFMNPAKILKGLTKELVESCYTPIIQSGGVYDLRPSAVSNDDNLHFGTILCSVGARYRHYCSNVARTYLVDPSPDQEKNYTFLLAMRDALLKAIKPGVKISAIWDVAKDMITKQRPELEPNFVKNIGFGTGLEFRESALSLGPKNTRVIQPSMTFNLCIGFSSLERKGKLKDDKLRTYALMLADTVLVKATGIAENLTKQCDSAWADVSYFLEDDEEEEEAAKKGKEKSRSSSNGRSSRDDEDFGRRRTRSRENQTAKDTEGEEKRRKHQQELEERKREEAERRFREEEEEGPVTKRGVRQGDYISYSDKNHFPKDAKPNIVHVDTARENVLLPIYGTLVPFHISTIKSASRNEDFLRINFITPISNFIGTNKQPRAFKDPKATFIRELTYRISDQRHLNNSLRLIQDTRKKHLARVETATVREGLVEQEELILNKGRVPRLTDLYVRPNISGRRTLGSLEVHKNGFRFKAAKGATIDILFKNIKHAFYQPADKDPIVLIHFHLHHGIIIGKKRVQDVQVYTEVGEIAQSIDGSRSRGMMERDDIEDEARERAVRKRLNEEFHSFVKKIEDLEPSLEFDIPYRDLGFFGVPGRTSVFLMPTVHCLVQLIEPPYFILTLDEIEIAHFERVQFSLKNFDIVFVHKNLDLTPTQISAVPMTNLEAIKEWLDECNIKYYEGPTSLNWKIILSTIRDDPKKFWAEGGWNFLSTEGSDDEDNESDEEEAYEPSDDGEGDEDDKYEGGSSDSDASEAEYEDDDDDDDDDEEDEDDDGDDWDELERKAAIADKQRGQFEEDERPTGRSRRRNDEYSDDEDDVKRRQAAARGRGGAQPPPAKRAAVGGSTSGRPTASTTRVTSSTRSSAASSAAGQKRKR